LSTTPFLAAAAAAPIGTVVGRVARVVGLTIEGRGITAPIGDLVAVDRPGMRDLLAEVVGFKEGAALMMPSATPTGSVPGARVKPLHRKVSVGAGRDSSAASSMALGVPLDGAGPVGPTVDVPLLREAPSPMERRPIDVLATGVSVIDAFLTLGRGQRVGIFAGSGVGKSTLLGDISREALLGRQRHRPHRRARTGSRRFHPRRPRRGRDAAFHRRRGDQRFAAAPAYEGGLAPPSPWRSGSAMPAATSC
jgi:flagellar biosynthesis/type III secretory pathway ATPase